MSTFQIANSFANVVWLKKKLQISAAFGPNKNSYLCLQFDMKCLPELLDTVMF